VTEPTLTAMRLAILALACLGFAACAGEASPPPSAPVLVGTVMHVYDGDTIKLRLASGPIIVRLHSIDTPEHDQPWGPQAAQALARRIQGREVSLAVVTHDSYERLVADVFLGEESINAWMVRQGNAWAYRHYLADRSYCSWEGEARASRRGLWSEPPDTWRAPWQWRAVERGESVAYSDYSHETVARCVAEIPAHAPPSNAGAPAGVDPSGAGGKATAEARPGGCQIKGNIGSSGRIYHLPGSDSYAGTRIDGSKGERWFCTEAEARAAGWRPAGSQ
jgi:endonuclease YncB( thermonuclease family)